jgi:16S rRNA processing protein RimM
VLRQGFTSAWQESRTNFKAVTTTETSWVVLARIVRPQGRRGELLADILTDFPQSFAQRKRLYLRTPGPHMEDAVPGSKVEEAKLEAHWLHKGRVVLKFAGVDSISDAEKLRNCEVLIPFAERMPLTGDAVYVSDLIGARVIDVRGGGARDVGEIIDVQPEGVAPAMLVVRTGAREPALIPFVRAYLKRVDLTAKRVEMDLPDGLLSLQAPLTPDEREEAVRLQRPGQEDN